jgi:hypothetical protein
VLRGVRVNAYMFVGVGTCFLLISLCCYINLSLSFIGLVRVLNTMTNKLQAEQWFSRKKISRDWMTEDVVSTNCGCPSRTLESP